jgi:large subunit ribosomal protein L9
MARSIELLLTETIENLGIVGDIVKVKPGFARNFLLPHAMAEFPTAAKIEALKEERAKAQAMLAKLRAEREALLNRMNAVEITLTRSCNDQGVLYGSITQRDISDALLAAGYGVDVRSVRLSQSIRRVGAYHVPIQFEKDLKTDITLNVKADRLLESDKTEDRTPHDTAGEGAESAEGESTQADDKNEGGEGRSGAKGDWKREGKSDKAPRAGKSDEKSPKSEGKPAKGDKSKAAAH